MKLNLNKILYVCLAILIVFDGYRVPADRDPGPGSIVFAIPLIFRILVPDPQRKIVPVLGTIFALLVIAANHNYWGSYLWDFTEFLVGLSFVFWERLAR